METETPIPYIDEARKCSNCRTYPVCKHAPFLGEKGMWFVRCEYCGHVAQEPNLRNAIAVWNENIGGKGDSK